jgi:molybdate transport system substrate-binding protein
MRRLLTFCLLSAGLVAAACGSDDAASTDTTEAANPTVSGTINVFAASSLTASFTALADAFRAEHPDSNVTLNFANSGDLVAQIIQGAPADVYASADLSNMTKLIDAGEAAGEPVVFANNLSEIIVAPGNPLGITGVEDLENPDVILVLCTPEAPCARYAEQIFEKAGVEVTPDSLEQNANAVVTKVTLGEADAGIVFVTDVLAAGDDADGVAIPADLNVVAEYPIVPTTSASNPETAQAFVDFVSSAAGRAILQSFGFTSP